MGDWKVTATTIYCDAVDDDVTIIVDSSWHVRCTGFNKYGESASGSNFEALKKKSGMVHRTLKCEGPLDYRVTNYRDRLMEEEKSV